MNLALTLSIQAYSPHADYDTRLHGFTPDEEKKITRVLKSISLHLQTNFKSIVSAPGLGAIHGRYLHDSLKIQINPHIFQQHTVFGTEHATPQWEFALIHEIGHSVLYHLSATEQQNWRNLSGWKKDTGTGQAAPYKETRPGWPKETSLWTHKQDAQFVRKYQRKSPHEDFADNMAYILTGNSDQVPEKKRRFILNVIVESKRQRG